MSTMSTHIDVNTSTCWDDIVILIYQFHSLSDWPNIEYNVSFSPLKLKINKYGREKCNEEVIWKMWKTIMEIKLHYCNLIYNDMAVERVLQWT